MTRPDSSHPGPAAASQTSHAPGQTLRGKFISLEGGEGAGKSTLLAGMRQFIEQRGLGLVLTREPGGTALGEAVRAIVLDPLQRGLVAEAELLLMFASRAQLVREVILPALAAGQWVLSDRFADASHAYQGGGRGQPVERIDALEEWACAGLKPDLTLLLDLPVSAGMARVAGRGAADRIEVEADAFFERVRASYRARAAAEPQRFRVIDASAAASVVLQAAQAALADLLSEPRP
jgi:dTMP kinase